MFAWRTTIIGYLLTCAFLLAACAAEGPEETLKQKGLQKQGNFWILPEELDFLRACSELKKLETEYRRTERKAKNAGGQANQTKAEVQALQKRLQVLRRQIQITNDFDQVERLKVQTQQLQARLAELEEIENVRAAEGIPDPASEVEAIKGAFLVRIIDLREAAEAIDDAYAKLEEDSAVRSAIDQLNALQEEGRPTIELGPSRSFLAHRRTLANHEKKFLSDRIPIRSRSGTFEIDVILNGKWTKSMCFDTGSSTILLTHAVAEEIGCPPTDDDPLALMELADGSQVPCRVKLLDSVQVGRFKVSNVECAILPADRATGSLLLGGSFLKHFTYRMDPDKSHITLVELKEDGGKGAK